MQILHNKTSYNNMLKSIANLTISKEKIKVYFIGRSSAEWLSRYLPNNSAT